MQGMIGTFKRTGSLVFTEFTEESVQNVLCLLAGKNLFSKCQYIWETGQKRVFTEEAAIVYVAIIIYQKG